MKTLTYMALVLATILSDIKGFAQLDPSTFTKVDSLLHTTVPRSFNGVVLVTHRGKTIYSKTRGYADFKNGTSFTIDDNFRIQSNTKQVTAALVLLEVEKGRVDLHRPIRKYLPDLSQSWADTITVHQLLNMSSGIIHLDRPLAFQPGKGFHYSNPAYGLLGKILQNVTGKTYAEIAEALFKKLDMQRTYCFDTDHKRPDLVRGHTASEHDTAMVEFDRLGFTKQSWEDFLPTGGLISNVRDLTLWDEKLHGGLILSPKSYDMMVQSDIQDRDTTFSDGESTYGYGVNVSKKGPLKYIGHAGRGLGFVSIKIYIPERDLGIIVWENTYHRDLKLVYHFEREIRRIILEAVN